MDGVAVHTAEGGPRSRTQLRPVTRAVRGWSGPRCRGRGRGVARGWLAWASEGGEDGGDGEGGGDDGADVEGAAAANADSDAAPYADRLIGVVTSMTRDEALALDTAGKAVAVAALVRATPEDETVGEAIERGVVVRASTST